MSGAARLAWFLDKGLAASFEGIEEVGQDLIDAWALGDEPDMDALMWSFAVGMGSGGIYTLGGAGMNRLFTKGADLADKAAKTERAKKFGVAMDNLTKAIADSKTAARMPEAMEDFIQDATEGKLGELYIDGHALAQYA
ncbi:MAG: hypothetical protein LBT08_01020, partial [Synergistaceae bacterium]|nr:hypothetical protein [Synergistaceae bacterium]